MDKGTEKIIKFQYFPGDISKCSPLGFVSLSQFIKATKSPKQPKIFAAIAHAASIGDETTKAKLKQENLFSFVPSSIVRGRRAQKYITEYTGIAVLDYDHMTPESAKELKEYLFKNYPCIFTAYLSPSGHGVKGLVRIPIVETLAEFRAYFQGITNEFLQHGNFDSHGKNPVQPLFQSFDPELLYREDPETWDIMAEPPIKSKPIRQMGTTESKPRNHTPKGQYSPRQIESAGKIIQKIAETMFRRITDTGHPNVVKIGLILGGYVGEGLITHDEAVKMMDEGISGHQYLKQKKDIYKITARWAISEGQVDPLKLVTSSTITRPSCEQMNSFLTI